MKGIIHERPGVYSSYDASAAVRGGRAARTVGVAAKSASGTANAAVRLTSYEMGLSAFGEDAEGTPGMSAILKLLFLGGASTVVAVKVDEDDYASAFRMLQTVENLQVIVCDSGELTVQQALRGSLESASAARRERIAVVGMSDASTTDLTERAKALNSERMVLVGPDVLDGAGKPVSGVFAAAVVAAAVAMTRDPAIPLNGTPLNGLTGVSVDYTDSEIDVLVRTVRVLEQHDVSPGEPVDDREVSLEVRLQEIHRLAGVLRVRVHVIAEQIHCVSEGVQRVALAHVDDVTAEQDELGLHKVRHLGAHIVRLWCVGIHAGIPCVHLLDRFVEAVHAYQVFCCGVEYPILEGTSPLLTAIHLASLQRFSHSHSYGGQGSYPCP